MIIRDIETMSSNSSIVETKPQEEKMAFSHFPIEGADERLKNKTQTPEKHHLSTWVQQVTFRSTTSLIFIQSFL